MALIGTPAQSDRQGGTGTLGTFGVTLQIASTTNLLSPHSVSKAPFNLIKIECCQLMVPGQGGESKQLTYVVSGLFLSVSACDLKGVDLCCLLFVCVHVGLDRSP